MDQNEKIPPKNIFGLRGILVRYHKELGKDMIWPLLFSLGIITPAYFIGIYSPVVLEEALRIGLVVIPVLLSVLVAGYVLLLTIYFSGNIEIFKNNKDGRDMMYAISANYAFCIINSILALVILIIMSFFFRLNLTSEHHVLVNFSSAAVVYLLLFFTLKNLKDLVLSLFDFGQSFIFEKQLGKKPNDNE